MSRYHYILSTAFLAVVTACSSANIKPAEVNPTDMPKGPGLLSGKSGNLLEAFNKKGGDRETGGNIGVNIYLWRAALETMSFMPITQADSNGGVIVTDWYVDSAKPVERLRANVLILGKTLQPAGLKVTLFRQEKDKENKWLDVPVDVVTTRALEDMILSKARQIKVRTAETQ